MTLLEAIRPGFNQAGLCFLPVKGDGSKAPDVSAWTAFQTTRPTVAQMRHWDFAHRCGVGMIAGAVSGYREAWDFDEAFTFEAFITAAGKCGLGDVVQRLRAGYEDQTPAGGRRWIVQYPATVTWKDLTLARRPGREGEPATKVLIELPMFAILAPSNGTTHPSGRAYVRVSGSFQTIAAYTNEERDALFALARSFDEMPRREATRPPAPPSRTTNDRPGDDFNRRTTWAQLLEPAGWTHVFDRGDVAYWCRPGKAHGISATTNFGNSDLFYAFTSSSAFEPDVSYTKFGVFTLIEHGGDYAQAALALSQRGFGARATRPPRSTASAASPAVEPATRAVHLTRASAIAVRPVRWSWQDRLALGTFALIGGREGVGKSICVYTIAARITKGTLPGVYDGTPRGVIVAATEDSWEHTIVPRLMAAAADLDRVFRVDVTTLEGAETALSLPTDLAELARVIPEADAALVILDPLLSRLDTALDTHKDAEVRLALEPLVTLAGVTDVTVLGLIHVNKSSSSDVLTLLMGSRAFAAVARTVLFVMTDPDDETRRLLGQAKNNLGRLDLPTLAFRIAGVLVASTAEGDVWTGQLEWLGESERSIREAIDVAAESAGDRSAAAEAADWLLDYLTSQEGTADSAIVKREGAKAGHSREALRRACHHLHVQTKGVGFPRKTFWFLSSRHGFGRLVSPVSAVSAVATDVGETDKEPTNCIQLPQSTQLTQSPQTPRAREATATEDLSAWVTEDEPALLAGESDSAFADHDEHETRSLTDQRQDRGDASFRRGWQ